jgi:hypothetical protein
LYPFILLKAAGVDDAHLLDDRRLARFTGSYSMLVHDAREA